MDPLSISASILTLLGACSAVLEAYKKIREIRKVPDVIFSLNNEVADLKLVLQDIHELREEFFRKDPAQLSSGETQLLHRCHGLLEHTWSKVHEAEVLINTSIQSTGPNSRTMLHSVLNSRENRRLARLQTGIREAKESIQSLWRQLDRRHSAQIQVQLSSIQETSTHIRSRLLEDNQVLHENNQRIEKKLDKLLEMNQVLSSPSPRSVTNISTSIASATHGTKRLDIALMRVPYTQTSFGRSCRCRDRVRSFKYAHSFLGDLFLGYAATPTFSSHSPDCQYIAKAEIVLVYSFPTWFLNYTLALRAKYDSTLGLECALSVRPVLPYTHVAWDIVQSGDVEGFKSLLITAQIALEARDPNGNGFLFYAISLGNSEMAAFLIKIGADREAESYGGKTPYHYAWDEILYNPFHEEYNSRLMTLFPDPDFDELYEFSGIHKAILGLGPDSIEGVVSREPSIIDKVDRFGRSPLAWAVMQGNEEAIELLLSRKAEVDQLNQNGSSPLMQAAHFGKFSSIRILLQARANAKLKNQFGMTPLHYLMQSKPQSRYLAETVESLLNAGSDINAANVIGMTPLSSAVYHGASKSVELLIRRGANPDARMTDGHSPLTLAVQQNRHSILKALLDRGIDHLDSLRDFGTLMHLIAQQADVETLHLLLDYRLKPREINVKNREGLTPKEVGCNRDSDWSKAFRQFLKSIDKDIPMSDREPELAREYSYPWPTELPTSEGGQRKVEITTIDTSSNQTAVDPESPSDDEFVDAVQGTEDLVLTHESRNALEGLKSSCHEGNTRHRNTQGNGKGSLD